MDALSRLPTENLVFTLEGKIKVPEEKAETVIGEVHRQGHLGENKTWKAFNQEVQHSSRETKMQRSREDMPRVSTWERLQGSAWS